MIDELIEENKNLKEALKIALARIAQLEEQLKLNSKNSSRPPSSDQKKNSKDQPKNRGGGQKGHPPHLRKQFEAQDIQNTHHCSTNICPRCGATRIIPNSTSSHLDQVELENRKVSVTRYHRPFYRCTGCKRSFCAPLPKKVSPRCFGPRFEAMVTLMTGEYHLSKRQVSAMIKDLFELTISPSTVSNIEKRAHRALDKAYLLLKSHLKQASYKGVDETSWRDQGLNHYIWVASIEDAVCFSISRRRNRLAFHNFLGEAPYGMTTDRYSVYRSHKGPHQYCLAHILRDFQRIADRSGNEGEIGQELVFHLKEVFKLSKDNLLDLNEKHQRMRYRKRCLKRLLTEGLYYEESPRFMRFCERLLDDYDRLWTFLSHPELECHNNRSERDLRPLVLWRKKSFGTQSRLGQEFVERIASVCGTCKKRKQSLLSFLSKSFCASLFGEKFPSPLAH